MKYIPSLPSLPSRLKVFYFIWIVIPTNLSRYKNEMSDILERKKRAKPKVIVEFIATWKNDHLINNNKQWLV